MSIIGQNILAGASSAGGYEIDQSLRFNRGDQAYLDRTPGSAGDARQMTVSVWVKGPSETGGGTMLEANGTDWDWWGVLGSVTDTTAQMRLYLQGGIMANLITTRLFRDPTNWYHMVLSIDTDQATAADRIKMYINGEQINEWGTFSMIAQNTNIYNFNAAVNQRIQSSDAGSALEYLSEYHFIDGQQLPPTAFAETDELTGEWKAKKFEGTYGSNGYYLKFEDSSDFGNDSSGNGNDFTANSLNADDQVPDTPTNNWCTWHPINGNQSSMTEGMMKAVGDTGNSYARGPASTFAMSSGKWYWEYYITAVGTEGWMGIIPASRGRSDNYDIEYIDGALCYKFNGDKTEGTGGGIVNSTYGNSWTTADILGFAVDMDNDAIYFSKNGVWQDSGDPTSGASRTGAAFTDFSGGEASSIPHHIAVACGYGSTTVSANFGQDGTFAGVKTAQGNADSAGKGDFYYSVPSGYKSLCRDNLPEPAIKLSTTNFSAQRYTGNGATRSITGVGFQPDFLWIKLRSGSEAHQVMDVTRGVAYTIASNSNGAQGPSKITSFDSDGWTMTSATDVNGNESTYVGYSWKAGGAPSANTDGTINTSVSANTTNGFSVVTYTGNGTAGATIGHGLTKAPDLVIVKRLDALADWQVYNIVGGPTKYLQLNDTGGYATDTARWNDTAPTTSVVSLGTTTNLNGNTNTYVAYCFHSVEGFSKVGGYVGNGESNGQTVYTGFKPEFVMVKRTEATGSPNWATSTAAIGGPSNVYNTVAHTLAANSANGESNFGGLTSNIQDYGSNYFKFRNGGAYGNADGGTYLYIAMAQKPYNYSRSQ